MVALTGVGSGIHGNNAAWAEETYNVFMDWWEKHGAFRPDWSPKQASEVAFVAAIAFMEKKFTSTNTARDEIAVDILRGVMARTLFSDKSKSAIVSEFQRQLSSLA